jgi:hypothetical protein
MQVRPTFFTEIHIRSLILTHHTHARPMLPNIAPLTTYHKSRVFDIGIRKRVILAPADTASDFGRPVFLFLFLFFVVIGSWTGEGLFFTTRRLVVGLERVSAFSWRRW